MKWVKGGDAEGKIEDKIDITYIPGHDGDGSGSTRAHVQGNFASGSTERRRILIRGKTTVMIHGVLDTSNRYYRVKFEVSMDYDECIKII